MLPGEDLVAAKGQQEGAHGCLRENLAGGAGGLGRWGRACPSSRFCLGSWVAELAGFCKYGGGLGSSGELPWVYWNMIIWTFTVSELTLLGLMLNLKFFLEFLSWRSGSESD